MPPRARMARGLRRRLQVENPRHGVFRSGMGGANLAARSEAIAWRLWIAWRPAALRGSILASARRAGSCFAGGDEEPLAGTRLHRTRIGAGNGRTLYDPPRASLRAGRHPEIAALLTRPTGA